MVVGYVVVGGLVWLVVVVFVGVGDCFVVGCWCCVGRLVLGFVGVVVVVVVGV